MALPSTFLMAPALLMSVTAMGNEVQSTSEARRFAAETLRNMHIMVIGEHSCIHIAHAFSFTIAVGDLIIIQNLEPLMGRISFGNLFVMTVEARKMQE